MKPSKHMEQDIHCLCVTKVLDKFGQNHIYTQYAPKFVNLEVTNMLIDKLLIGLPVFLQYFTPCIVKHITQRAINHPVLSAVFLECLHQNPYTYSNISQNVMSDCQRSNINWLNILSQFTQINLCELFGTSLVWNAVRSIIVVLPQYLIQLPY